MRAYQFRFSLKLMHEKFKRYHSQKMIVRFKQISKSILQTALQFCFLVLAFTNISVAMTFEKQERCLVPAKPKCQMVILAVGQIDQQTPEQFKAIAKDFPQGSWVVLSSPGGSVVSAMRMGQHIREAGFNTTIGATDYSPPNCLSSCAYAFAGGVSRSLPEGSKYGIHQFRGKDKALSEDEAQKISATLATYLDVMGVDRHLLDYAQVTTSEKMSLLSLTQAKLLKVDNTGQSPYPRWRLEATTNSQLVAVNNPPTLSGNPSSILGLMQVTNNDKSKKIVFLLFYKSENEAIFKQRIDHQLTIDQKSFALKQVEDWQKKTNGFQAGFMITEEALIALAQAPEESTINLKSSVGKVRFGVGGFKNIYQVFMGSDGKEARK